MRMLALAWILLIGVPVLAQPDPACPTTLAPRLTIGESGLVSPGSANNLRDTPTRSGNRVGQMPGGSLFMVLDGPVCADDFNWWQVDYSGLVAWTVEASADAYFLEPAPLAAPSATVPPVPTVVTPSTAPVAVFEPPVPVINVLEAGARARVINDNRDEALRLRVRAQPGADASVVTTLTADDLVTILDGPQEANGYRWWQIETTNGAQGWVIEGLPSEDSEDYQRTLLPLCPLPAEDRIAFLWFTESMGGLGFVITAYPDGTQPCLYDRAYDRRVYFVNEPPTLRVSPLTPLPDKTGWSYVSMLSGDDAFVTFTMTHEGIRSVLADNRIDGLDWSEDGLRLAYIVQGELEDTLWTQRSDGSVRGRLSTLSRNPRLHRAVMWLTDNQTLLFDEFERNSDPVRHTINTVDVTAGGIRTIATVDKVLQVIVPSPDRTRLFLSWGFTRLSPDTPPNQAILDIASGQLTEVEPAFLNAALWTPDGETVITFYRNQGSDLYLQAITPDETSERVPSLLKTRFDFIQWLNDEEILVYLPYNDTLARLNVFTGAYTAVPLTID